MTDWLPDLAHRSGPRYRAIAEAMADAIRGGSLTPGTRLPTHRELAWRLGVTVGTVTRAYREATARGLIDGEIGRGTFVRDARIRSWGEVVDAGAPIDFGLNFPPCQDDSEAALRRTLAEIASDNRAPALTCYDPSGGRPAHRAALADWLRHDMRMPAEAACTLVTAGAQHGISVALAATFEPGDVVLCERLTHPGFKSAAAARHLRVVPLDMDAGGLLPDALDSAIRQHRPKGVFLIPTLQNPTASVLSEARRDAVAGIVARHRVTLIEDDIYHAFAEGAGTGKAPIPIAARIPEHSLYVTGASKHLAPGLRVGAVHGPTAMCPRLMAGLRDTLWMVPPLVVEILVRWLADGTAERLVEAKRQEQTARGALARARLGGWLAPAPAASPHLWLAVPEPWRGAAASTLVERGVTVADGPVFAVAPGAGRDHIRLALGKPAQRAAVQRGLDQIAATFARDPALDRAVM
ncbi:MAG: PLP-dependent aminotransferase family protein [Thalassobaculum sp.]|uniref:aminotransferase-like domain-containing protein n=1 Tax=Thalassobaculum sp. TaxID=2022740 RepID=UPI0032EB497F